MGQYATQTSVSVERSKAEIEGLVMRYGASGFASGWQGTQASIEFCCKDRRVRFIINLPDRNEKQFTRTPHRQRIRSPQQRLEAWEQSCRQLWRALALAIKARLEAVECGIATFEDEFLANVVDPLTNKTVGEIMRPQIADSYSGRPARLLLCGPSNGKDSE